MPDRSDVEQVLAALVASTLYPGGAEGPSAIGVACRVYRGWPVPTALDADLARGIVHVTVQPVSGTVRDRTRFSQEWQGSTPAPSISGSIDGDTVAFDGQGGAGQVAGILVDGRPYAYRIRNGDTPSLVAAALAAQISADRPAVALGATVSLPGGEGLLARVVTDGQGGSELRRQEARFRVTLWCPDPAMRDRVGSVVDPGLAAVTFMDVGGWACRVRYSGDSSTDEGSGSGLWRRDLLYSVEYPTVLQQSPPSMLFGFADVNGVSNPC